MYEIEKYYVWKNGNHADTDGFWNYDEAYEYAMEIEADEIELARWHEESAYEKYQPADDFKTVWRRKEKQK